jgi:hypothetical protein
MTSIWICLSSVYSLFLESITHRRTSFLVRMSVIMKQSFLVLPVKESLIDLTKQQESTANKNHEHY